MHTRFRLATALALAFVLLAPAAMARHMDYYAQVFIEHDDQGRSDEPDFQSTSVLGPTAVNCVVDFSPADPGPCVPDTALPQRGGQAATIAPGCTDDSGRQPSGLCGLWTIGAYHPIIGDPSLATPPGEVGVQGMGGQAAPGRITPLKSSQVRFLDIVTTVHTFTDASTYIDVNHKLQDTGVAAALASVDPNFGNKFIAGDTGIWAWYGNWADKNGNGVIDHLDGTDYDSNSNTCPQGCVRADNEFVWAGKCIQFNGQVAPGGQQYCKNEPGSAFPLWIWPGNHHAFCGGAAPSPVPATNGCYLISADLPAHQAICFVDVLSQGSTPVFCDQNFATYDITDEAVLGDPLLGPQYAVWPDQFMGDRTGELQIGGRHWIYGNGWNTRFYDQSTLVTAIFAGGPTTQAFNPESRQRFPYDITKFQAFDVDRYSSLNPAVEDLVQNSLKPAARSAWVPFRDNFIPIQNSTDALQNGAALDTSATTQPVDDAFINPGWSREPNTAFDRFPAARFNAFAASGELPEAEQRHRGWLNDYSAHQGAWHAFADIQADRMYHTNLAWRHPTSGNCLPQMCTTGGGTFSSNQYLSGLTGKNVRHERTMEPGIWVFSGFVGAWRDGPNEIFDEVVDLEATLASGSITTRSERYIAPADGWMGSIVNNTGTWKYRGYPGPSDANAPECTIAGVKAKRYFAECNPYWSGTTFTFSPYGGPFQDTGVDLEDPQGGGVEFAGFPNALPTPHFVLVYPAASDGTCDPARAGTWTVPIIRWNAFDTWRVGDMASIRDLTGTAGAGAVIAMQAGQGTGLFTRDVLVLPEGNAGMTVCTEVAEQVVINNSVRGIFVNEPIREVDVYTSWV